MRQAGTFRLANGIRVVYQQIQKSAIVHCGVFLGVGSRDETAENQGIAHFWEHMAFKGTRKRKSFHIINALDSIGGELNAFTEKEKVVFYASVRNNYLERAVDIVTDIAFNSSFPSHEIEKERGVILEEMAMYHDDPDDSLTDEFEAVIFRDHPMGMNILGRSETVRDMRRSDFISFVRDHIDLRNVVFSIVGNVSELEIQALAKRYLARVSERHSIAKRLPFRKYKPQEVVQQRGVTQARCAIGRSAYSVRHQNRIPFYMLVNFLGGPGLNSRLNYLLREKRGMVYSVDAHFIPFSDTGLFGIYFGTEPKQLNKAITIIRQELERLRDSGVGKRQLTGLKEQIKGHLALAEESRLNVMLMMGRSILDYGRVPPLEEVCEKVDDVTADDLQQIAGAMFNPDQLSYLILEPTQTKS